MTGKAELMDVQKFDYTLYHNKAVLDMLKSGLDVLGVNECDDPVAKDSGALLCRWEARTPHCWYACVLQQCYVMSHSDYYNLYLM